MVSCPQMLPLMISTQNRGTMGCCKARSKTGSAEVVEYKTLKISGRPMKYCSLGTGQNKTRNFLLHQWEIIRFRENTSFPF